VNGGCSLASERLRSRFLPNQMWAMFLAQSICPSFKVWPFGLCPCGVVKHLLMLSLKKSNNQFTCILSERISDDEGLLKPGLIEHQHFDVVPQAVWNLFVQWYSLAPGSVAMPRSVVGPPAMPTVSAQMKAQLRLCLKPISCHLAFS
jgi:hypothetical protein